MCFAIASYAVTATGTALSCAVWLHVFTVPPRTLSYRPMGASGWTLIIGGLSTILAASLALACIASNRRRLIVWLVGVPLLAASLLPLPTARRFMNWALRTQGLEMAP